MPDLELLLQKVLDAVVVMRSDGTVADWNACAETTFGWTRAEALQRSMNDLIVPPQHRKAHANGLKRYLQTGTGPVLDNRIEITALDKAGREFPIELSITETDYLGERAFIGFLRDISERKRAEVALRESEARLEATYNHAFVGIAEVDQEGRFLRVNEQYQLITGFSSDDLRERSIFSITHPDDVFEDRGLFARQWRGEFDNYTIEKRYVRKDGRIVWVEIAASIVRGSNGARSYAVRIVRDVTEKKETEEHQRLLLTELKHRVKNSLAVVQALAFQTFRMDAVSAGALRTFDNRLSALAKAHDLLVKQNWTSPPMRQVMEVALSAFDLSRFSISGPDVLLHPQTAVTFSLALHELATNASKFGSLSVPHGSIDLTWSNSNHAFTLKWQETGGPAVTPPARRGFGSRLLVEGLARELSGGVELKYAPEGLICEMTAPGVPDDRGGALGG